MSDPGTHAARSTALRETAKWIAVAFTGAGAVLFSGLSFTNTSSTAVREGWKLPLLLAALPLLAAAWALRSAARVVTVQGPSVERLLPFFAKSLVAGSPEPLPEKDRRDLERLLPDIATTYGGGVVRFDERLVAAHQQLAAAEEKYSSAMSEARRADRDSAATEYERLKAGIPQVVQAAELLAVQQAYRRSRWHLAGAGLVAVAAVAGSGVLAAKAQPAGKQDGVVAATVQQPAAVKVFLAAGAQQRLVGPGRCPVRTGSDAVALGGTYTRPLLLIQPAADAAASLAGPCRVPWIWETAAGDVTIVPAAARPVQGG
ncbi:hypothetical protein [Actinoplanes sp. RD1]|uniref:hypothetical protein n=1 Tax=Actinoplanes sp. RD1 TaxID=3064538 RepID=UPI002741AA58|nr:hypothetical protein [Actinoplanes sp. RD1]